MKPDKTLDALGLLCPLPVLKARKLLGSMSAGQILKIAADDPASVIDFPHFCRENGHELLLESHEGPALIFYIRRGR